MKPSTPRCSRSYSRTALLSLVLGLLPRTTQAQNRFCIGGDLDHLSAAQRAVCSSKLAAVRSAALRFGAPDGWHFVMVCGEAGWKEYASFSSRPALELERASSDTDRAAFSTYFREESFNGGELSPASQRLVAREMAALAMPAANEAALQARVELWMQDLQGGNAQTAKVLRASR